MSSTNLGAQSAPNHVHRQTLAAALTMSTVRGRATQAGTKLAIASLTAAPKQLNGAAVGLALAPASGAELLRASGATAASGQFCKLSDNTPRGLDAARVYTLYCAG